jgi:uncharacterized protein
MAVRIEKTFRVAEPIEKVWAFLSDPRKVAACVPGAKITEAIDDHNFKGSISVRIGPTVTDYKGDVRIERLDPAAHEIELFGKGQDVRGKGSASMKMTGKLNAVSAAETEVVGISEVNVVGMLAQFGARMINDVSDVIFEEFTKNFQQQLRESATAPSASAAEEVKPINAGSVLASATRAGVARIIGKIVGGSEKK